VVDRLTHWSRRLLGLSPMSPEPLPQRHRRNPGFQPVAAGLSKIDPPIGVIDWQDRPGTSRELERNTLVLSRVLFQLEENIELEELSKSIAAPNSPIPPDYLDVLLYVKTLTNRPSNPGHRYFPLVSTTGSMASTTSVMSMQTLVSVKWGGTISIPFVTPSTTIFGSTSIPSLSGSCQVVASSIGFFPFGIPTNVIPLVPLSIPSAASTSMASGSSTFQGFPFRGGHIPHSTPTLGSMPLSSTGQSYNLFQSWANTAISGLGVRNQYYLGQQGNMSYSFVSSF